MSDEFNSSPMYSILAEQAVLGAVLLDPGVFDDADEMLSGDEFYQPEHPKIFEAMKELRDSDISIDLVTLTAKLQDRGELEDIGGVSYLAKIARAVPTASNLRYYASIVKNRSIHREAIRQLQDQLQGAKQSDNLEEIIAGLQETAAAMADQTAKGKGLRKLGVLVRDHFDVVERRYANRDSGLTGVKTALTDLDKLTGGRQKGDLIIVAARPSVGKTALEMNEAVAASKSGTVNAVAFFSLEMSDVALVDRFAAMMGGIDGMKFKTGRLDEDDWTRYTTAASEMDKLPLYIDSDPGMTVQQIRSKARSFKREHGEIEIIVDYLQMISAGRKFPNRDTEVGYITAQLKEMARELDCPVIAISSLGRSVEQRQDKRPMMSDLRESGQIEFHADEVDFLYRDDYYNQETEKKNIVEIIVAKGRNTGTGTVEAVYMRNFCRFADYERGHNEQPPKQQNVKDLNKRKWAQ
ncbi:replicative DNA helicase [Paenibacillus forsythiae]|uniref:Replicative DNA helicase n=1 Tax=Paenibacillus forsythiae TaxID=365616 RepID=A0ABU3H5K0_9BACL|nr:replicative DNA helicase [Paenibacillus forsythiae]MDT3426100.1 replicative DNA helicase [Paenibacillus forsythiae]